MLKNTTKDLVKKLYDYMGFEYDETSIANDEKNGYLTENNGRDGNRYYWYMDGTKNVCICVETGEILDANHPVFGEENGKLIEDLFC